ncbi:hypothetical protein BGX38DRAFT_1275121 [Terfezia claveryi]|nr:hypothetical protein BGX38DRAFT_1275121 [Terfezia claveryi]
MSSDNQNITPRLASQAIEQGGADSNLIVAEIEVLIQQRKDEAITLMEKLPNILLALIEIKDLQKHEEVAAHVIKIMEEFVENTSSTIRFIEGEIEKLKEKLLEWQMLTASGSHKYKWVNMDCTLGYDIVSTIVIKMVAGWEAGAVKDMNQFQNNRDMTLEQVKDMVHVQFETWLCQIMGVNG